jgi:hypothetical protein
VHIELGGKWEGEGTVRTMGDEEKKRQNDGPPSDTNNMCHATLV